MGTITKFDPNCDRISLCERAELKLEQAKQRCEIEIRSRTTVLKVLLELNEELLLQSLQSSCDEIRDKLHKISLGKNSQGLDETVNFDLGFSSNTKHDASIISALHGLVSHNDALPSDLSLELVTSITQLKPGAAILLKVTSPKPILTDLVLSKLSVSVVDAITGNDSSVKFQKKICSPSEMMMRIKASEEGQYEVSTKLYGQHITHSPVIVPVMDDPERHLAEMGIFMSDQDAIKSSAQVTKEEPRTSVISVKVDNFTQYEEIIPDETVEVAEEENGEHSQFNEGPNAESEVEICEKSLSVDLEEVSEPAELVDWEKSLTDNLEDASETKLEDCLDVETDPVRIDLTDGDNCINDQDLIEIADSRGAAAIFNEINGLNQIRELNNSAENFDFARQQNVMILDEDNQWRKGVIENYIKTDNIYIVNTEAGYAGVAPGFIRSLENTSDTSRKDQYHFFNDIQKFSKTKNVKEEAVDGAVAVDYSIGEIPDQVDAIPDLVSEMPDLVDTVDSGEGLQRISAGSRLLWTSGDFCFAKWEEDNIWYNAKVLLYFDAEKKYSVQFTDYGNEDLVGTNNMVKKCTDIPEGELIDDYVLSAFEVKKPENELAEPETKEDKPATSPDPLSPLRRPSFLSREPVFDPLSDVRVDDALQSTPRPEASLLLKLPELSPVPPSLQCILCKKLAKRAMVLSCSHDLVLCWNCGVMKINVGARRMCWVCQEENISTKHMVRREELREAIDTFTKTGSLTSPKPENTIADPDQPQESSSPPFDILPLLRPGPEDVPTLHLSEVLKIDLQDPVGVVKLMDGTILILDDSSSDGFVRYNDMENFIEYVGPRLRSPSDVLVCRNGDIVITDKKGLHLFDKSLKFTKTLTSEFAGEYMGLTEDNEGNILTLHRKESKGYGKNMSKRTTSIIFLNRESGARKKIFDLEDFISEAIEVLGSGQPGELLMSECCSVKFKLGKIYITDMGLDCVYVIPTNSSNDASMFGGRGKGPGEFRDPTGIEVDDSGNMVVVDSRNHRLQVFNSETEFVGFIASNAQFSRPINIHFDFESRELFVTNKGSKAVSKFEF